MRKAVFNVQDVAYPVRIVKALQAPAHSVSKGAVCLTCTQALANPSALVDLLQKIKFVLSVLLPALRVKTQYLSV